MRGSPERPGAVAYVDARVDDLHGSRVAASKGHDNSPVRRMALFVSFSAKNFLIESCELDDIVELVRVMELLPGLDSKL